MQSNPDGLIDVPVRGPDGIHTVHVTVDDVRKENDQMWKWVLGELESIMGYQTLDGMHGAVEELYERLRRW